VTGNATEEEFSLNRIHAGVSSVTEFAGAYSLVRDRRDTLRYLDL